MTLLTIMFFSKLGLLAAYHPTKLQETYELGVEMPKETEDVKVESPAQEITSDDLYLKPAEQETNWSESTSSDLLF